MQFSWWCVYGFLKDWQTLIGALIALLAALLTIRVMRRQAKDENERHAGSLMRKEMASRAQMPDAISDMCQYVRNCFLYINQEQENDTVPVPSTGVLEVLKRVIEYIDDNAAQRTFELISFYQVQHVRLQNADKPLKQFDKNEIMYDGVLLYAYANSLFEYARNEASTASVAKPSREEMITAFRNAISLQVAVRDERRFEDLMAIIERRHDPE